MDLPSAPSFSAPSFSAPSLSGPISEADQERIKNEAQTFLERFGKTYVMEYKSSLIRKVKEELKGKEASPQLLRQRPDNSGPQVIMTGVLTKRGGFIKSWKRRHFVVKSDGSCHYFAKEEDPKPKGSIVLEGYEVNANPSTDIFSDKQHFFTIEHPDEDKRVWYIFADSEEEKNQWVAVLSQACKVAEGYVNPDAVSRESFKKAYLKIRNWYGMYYRTARGPEEEALADVVYDRIYSVILYDIVKDLSGAPKKMAVKAVKTSISALVSVAWKGMDQSTAKVRPTLEEKLKSAMAPLVKAEEDLKDKIQENVGERFINPAMAKVIGPFLAEVLPIMYPMLAEAFQAQIEISHAKLSPHVGNIKDPASSADVFRDAARSLDVKEAVNKLPNKRIEAYISKVEQVLKVVGKLDDVGGMVPKIKSMITDTFKPAVHLLFPPSVEESMLKMGSNTSYTFEMECKESSDAAAALNVTIGKLEHDLRLLFEEVVNGSIKSMVQGPFETFIGENAKSLIAPLSEAIPEELKDFIDPDAVLDDILEQALDGCVSTSCADGIAKLTAQLDDTLTSRSIPVL